MRVEPVSSYKSSSVYRKPTNIASSEKIVIKDDDSKSKSTGSLNRPAHQLSKSTHQHGIGENFDKYA